MTQSASQADAFYREVAESGELWTLEDAEGEIPIARAGSGDDEHDVTPVFSSEQRARKALETLPDGYSGHEPTRVEWDGFVGDLARRLADDAVRLGVNWTGDSARGYDIPVDEVIENVEAARR